MQFCFRRETAIELRIDYIIKKKRIIWDRFLLILCLENIYSFAKNIIVCQHFIKKKSRILFKKKMILFRNTIFCILLYYIYKSVSILFCISMSVSSFCNKFDASIRTVSFPFVHLQSIFFKVEKNYEGMDSRDKYFNSKRYIFFFFFLLGLYIMDIGLQQNSYNTK